MDSSEVVMEFEDCSFACDARVAALRWDLIEWALVLDVDYCTSEAAGAPLGRGWIVFEGLVDISLVLANARLANGLWIDSEIDIQQDKDGFNRYSMGALLIDILPDGSTRRSAGDRITIRAQRLVALRSERTLATTRGYLKLAERQALASDAAFFARHAEIEI